MSGLTNDRLALINTRIALENNVDTENILNTALEDVIFAFTKVKEEEMVLKMSSLENQVIPDSFKYENIVSLSNEARQKFIKIKPQTLGQASRISGVNPSDVQILMVYMGR